MTIEDIINELESYRSNYSLDEDEITDFFENIGEKIYALNDIDSNSLKRIIKSFFTYLDNHSSNLEENWTFIHLLESLNKPDYKIYNKILLDFNSTSPTITSVLLLNRYINSLSGDDWKAKVNLLKEICENSDFDTCVKEAAADFYNFQSTKS
jgi:hypothetical protein